MRKTTSGFTIVELLIVIVVIAILAAISVVAYTGIQDRAIATTVRSDLASFAKKIELAKVDSSDGGYPNVLTKDMGIEVTESAYQTNRWNWYYCITADHMAYSLGVVDIKNRGYFQSSVNGFQDKIVNMTAADTCSIVGAAWESKAGLKGTTTWESWVN